MCDKVVDGGGGGDPFTAAVPGMRIDGWTDCPTCGLILPALSQALPVPLTSHLPACLRCHYMQLSQSTSPPPHPSLPLRWTIDVYGAPGTLYEGEVFVLQVDFATNYPLEAPQVISYGASKCQLPAGGSSGVRRQLP